MLPGGPQYSQYSSTPSGGGVTSGRMEFERIGCWCLFGGDICGAETWTNDADYRRAHINMAAVGGSESVSR